VRDEYNVEFDPGDPNEPEWRAKLQALQALSEPSGLPAECFRKLETANNLEGIELCSNFGHDILLRAMHLARFSRKQLSLIISPTQFAKTGYGRLSSDPETYKRYIKGMKLQPELSADHNSLRQLFLDYKELSSEERKKRLIGLHIKNFRPTTTHFQKFVSALDILEALELNGCRSNPSLRVCHGCDDFFVENFAHILYPNLCSLAINSMFISGGRLRRFIKRHSATLTNVDIGYVMLTDGSWRSIAQGLAKLPLLSELTLSHLRQKHATKNTGRPAQFSNNSQVKLSKQSDVEDFLQAFIAFFGTIQYLTHARVSGSPPIYHEAKLFKIPNAVTFDG
jgi:hypothetical protein